MTGARRHRRLPDYAPIAMKDYLTSPDARTQRERQRKRLKLFLLGHIAYLATDLFLAWLYFTEAITGLVFWSFIASHVVINAGFVTLFLTGLNRRLPDRSLGHYAITVGVLSNLAVLALIGEYRAIYLIFCVTPFLSASFKLSMRQVAGLLALSQVGHLLVIGGLWISGQPISLGYEFALWLMLTAELLVVSQVAASVSAMRRGLLVAYGEAERLATADPLTGVLNRRALFDSIDIALRDPEPRTGDDTVLALIDLDHFKTINDNHGHDIGDQLLVAFTAAVRANIRGTDRFGRYGGDEFVLFLRGTTRPMAMAVFERIQGALAAIQLPGLDSPPSASIGAINVFRGLGVDEAIRRADAVLYEVKRSGRAHARLVDGKEVDPGIAAPVSGSMQGSLITV